MPSRQWLWMQQQRKAGKCWCGRELDEADYRTCSKCRAWKDAKRASNLIDNVKSAGVLSASK